MSFIQPKPPARSQSLPIIAHPDDDGGHTVVITGVGETVLSPRYPSLADAMRAAEPTALRPYDDDPRMTLEDVALALHGRA